jgi:hypothetical protein
MNPLADEGKLQVLTVSVEPNGWALRYDIAL